MHTHAYTANAPKHTCHVHVVCAQIKHDMYAYICVRACVRACVCVSVSWLTFVSSFLPSRDGPHVHIHPSSFLVNSVTIIVTHSEIFGTMVNSMNTLHMYLYM